MKKFMTIVLAILMLLIALFASNGVMGTGATIQGMQSAVRGEVGTFIMTDGAAYMLAWPQGQNYAWTVVSNARGIDPNAVRNEAVTLSKLLLDLEKNGFYYISFDQMPRGIVETILGYSLRTLIFTGVDSLPTIFMVPMMIFEPTPTTGVISCKILYPLWIGIALVAVFASRLLSLNKRPEQSPQQMLKALRDLYLSLPVPEGKVMNALTAQIVEWIDQERARIVVLNSVGVERVNLVRNDL